MEKEIARRPLNELACSRNWFDEFYAQVLDKQFEADARSGKLDQFADHAVAEFKSGKYSER